MVSNISIKILEVIPPHSLHRVKQGTILSLNVRVESPGKKLPLQVKGSKEAFPCSRLFSINSCSLSELPQMLIVKSIPVSVSDQYFTPFIITQCIKCQPESIVNPIDVNMFLFVRRFRLVSKVSFAYMQCSTNMIITLLTGISSNFIAYNTLVRVFYVMDHLTFKHFTRLVLFTISIHSHKIITLLNNASLTHFFSDNVIHV